MKKILKYFIWTSGVVLSIPILYLIIALILSFIPQNTDEPGLPTEEIYLSSNGVHLEIILNKRDLSPGLAKRIHKKDADEYYSFGWGEKNFYLNTPTWGDLTFSTAFNAAFLKNNTLIHVYRYPEKKEDWISVPLDSEQLLSVNQYITRNFKLFKGDSISLLSESYGDNDEFYEALGRYSFRNTCNSWVNRCFYESGLPCCLWTPFDFSLLRLHENRKQEILLID